VNNAVIGGVLVSQKSDVDALAEKGHQYLNETQNECNLRSVSHKLPWVVVGEFHDIKTNSNFWIQQQMKSNCAWQFDEENCKRMRKFVVLTFLVDVDSVAHAKKHREYDALNYYGSVKHLSSLFWMD